MIMPEGPFLPRLIRLADKVTKVYLYGIIITFMWF